MIRSTSNDLKTWPQQYMADHPLRSKSVVMTLFGDVILPHGGALWLGSLIRLLAPFGISDRLVRTSVYRLAEDGWLSARRQGRRSLYTLRPSAEKRFRRAYRRIYSPTYLAWDGTWTQVMLLPQSLDADTRGQLRKELLWEGFGALSPTAFIHPNPDLENLDELLVRLGVRETVFAATVRAMPDLATRPLSQLVRQCWDLDAVSADYQHFLADFRPLHARLQEPGVVGPELAFVLRTLLIHAFRRVQLHDPQLPIELLPADWIGKAAYELCRDIYRLLYRAANEHALDVLRIEDAGAPGVEAAFYERFDGLEPTPLTSAAC